MNKSSTKLKYLFITLIFSLICVLCQAQTSTIASDGWANNSINTVIFRKNSLVSFKGEQFAAYYDTSQHVVLAKRKLGSAKWQALRTPYTGDAADAHKSISIMVDGEGYLHVAWGHHDAPLNYCKSIRPGSLKLGEKTQMTGVTENLVSYPEFYRLPNGDLLFFFRNGHSGNGSLVINRYDMKNKNWIRMQNNLIDGEGKRSAYWQTFVDEKGVITYHGYGVKARMLPVTTICVMHGLEMAD